MGEGAGISNQIDDRKVGNRVINISEVGEQLLFCNHKRIETQSTRALINNVFLIALVTKVFLNTAKVDLSRSGIEFRCVIHGEDVEGRSCTGGIRAVCDAITQLDGAVVIGIGSEGISVAGITLNTACISGVDGKTSDGKKITIAIRESIEELLFCKNELRVLLDIGQGDGSETLCELRSVINGLDRERRGSKGVAAIGITHDVVESDFTVEVSIGGEAVIAGSVIRDSAVVGGDASNRQL